jgi:hypothetical protein
MYIFSFIVHKKSSKIVLSGSLDFYSFLALDKGLVILINILMKKEGFL